MYPKIINLMLLLITIILFFISIVYLFLQQPKFGKKSSGERLEKIKQSPNYKNGQFQNLSHTPDLAEGVGYFTVMKEFFFGQKQKK